MYAKEGTYVCRRGRPKVGRHTRTQKGESSKLYHLHAHTGGLEGGSYAHRRRGTYVVNGSRFGGKKGGINAT